MSQEKPIVYILRGDDSTRIEMLIARFKAELGDPSMASLNTSVLDGTTATIEDIRSAAFAMPFLTERRLVILSDALARIESKKSEEVLKFIDLLNGLPGSTALVLVVEDKQSYRRGEVNWEKLTAKHWLMKWVREAGSRAWVEDCAMPLAREMPGWIMRKAKELGGTFSQDGARKLAEYVGSQTLRATQEINKLLAYVNYDRPVTSEDVVLLTAQEQEGNIFELTDALGERDGSKALAQLGILLETNDALELSGMIHRQFRLLLQAREILDERGGEEQVRELLNLHPYVAQKLTQQARQFSLDRLKAIYHRLLEIDIGIKSGGMPGEVAFELLFTDLTKQ